MPIATVCGDCRKKYTVKSEMAGKRFRCKDCEAIVTVPDMVADDDDEEEDPFGEEERKGSGRPVRQNAAADDDADDYIEPPRRERRIRREPKPKSVKKKRESGPAIPTSAVVALVVQSMLTGFLALGSLGTLVRIANEGDGKNVGSLIGIVVRFIIALIILLGLFQRKYSARQWSRGLSIFGDIAGGLIILAMVLIARNNPDAALTIIVMIGQCAAWTTMIVCLSTDSADDWFVE